MNTESTQMTAMSSEDNLHEILMQLEAIIFASDAAVSIARLKEAFQDRFTKTELRQYLQQLSMLQHGRSIELVETIQGFRFSSTCKIS